MRGIFFLFVFFYSFSFCQLPKWIQSNPCVTPSGQATPVSTNNLQFYEVDFTGPVPVFTQRNEGTSITNIYTSGISELINTGIDASGNVSFYVFGESVSPFALTASSQIRFAAFDSFTNQDEIFATIPGNPTNASSVRNLEIVTKPGSPGLYYVVYKTACINNLTPDEIRYVTVDMNTKTISSSILLSSGTNNEGMGITRLDCSTGNRYLFFSKFSSGTLSVYRSTINAVGISSPVLVTSALTTANSLGQGDLEISPDGSKLAIALMATNNTINDAALFDLNLSTGALTNIRWIDGPQGYLVSAEFSPDNQRLYLSQSGTYTIPNRLFNVAVQNTNYTISALDEIPVSLNAGSISMEIAYDQKLYFNNSGSITSLNVISNPNSNAAGNIVSQTLPNSYGLGNYSGNSFPDQIDGDFVTSSGNISLVASEDTICTGQSVTLTATGGTNYNWSNGLAGSSAVQNVSPSATITYSVSSSSSCGASSDSVKITVVSNPIAEINSTQEICESQSVTLLGSGGGSYFWNGSSIPGAVANVANPTVTTTYSLIVSNGDCLSSPASFTVTVHPKPVVDIIGDSILCEGENTVLLADVTSGTAPFSYFWSNGTTNQTDSLFPLTDLDLSLIVQDQFNCSDTSAIHIEVNAVPQALFQLNETGCAPLEIAVQNGSVGATDFVWDFGDGSIGAQVSGNHVYIDEGVYSVNLIASNGACSDTLTISNAVTVLPTPVASFSAYITDFSNPTEVSFTDHSSGSDSCMLYFGDGEALSGCSWNQFSHQYPSEGTYTITQVLTNASACVDTAVFNIHIYGETVFYVPNSFTPDGDEFNNVFSIVFPDNSVIDEFELIIFDRWGEIIFESADYHTGWDGTYHGKLVPNGTYVWKLHWSDKYTEMQEYVGHVNILR